MNQEMVNTDTEPVKAKTYKVYDLITGTLHDAGLFTHPLMIDRYQRPYVWDSKKVGQLLQDLESHTKGAYYLGSILLHERNDEKKKGLFVIDGQQRLTTLLLMYKKLFEEATISEAMKLSYYHRESFKNIRSAHTQIKQYIDRSNDTADFKKQLRQLEITIIKTNDVDLAFTFFDSQNSRGVPLKSTDLLKSYHLREINQDSSDHANKQYLERNSARRWEHLQTFNGILSTKHDFAFELFHKLLWRARRWKGNEVQKENRDLVLDEFQEGTVRDKTTRATEIPLYPNRHNMLSDRLVESKGDGLQRKGSNIKVSEKSSLLPFTLRQPIHKGLHYFLFAEKYAELLYELFPRNTGDTEDQEIKKFKDYFDSVVDANSYYLKELFMVCSVAYFDKYGSEKLFKFAELLGLAHGKLRMEQYYIFRQSALKYMREYNLIDIISHSFRPEEVIASLRNHIRGNGEEQKTTLVDLTDENNDGILDKGGVNERCYNAFQNYYKVTAKELNQMSEEGDALNLTSFASHIIHNMKSNRDGNE